MRSVSGGRALGIAGATLLFAEGPGILAVCAVAPELYHMNKVRSDMNHPNKSPNGFWREVTGRDLDRLASVAVPMYGFVGLVQLASEGHINIVQKLCVAFSTVLIARAIHVRLRRRARER
jgi:hypothetical protein